MIYEISQRCGPVSFQSGFCEGWNVEEGTLRLHRPFQRFLLHSKMGVILCRGAWLLGDWLPEDAYDVRPIQREAWMDLEIVDVLVAMDLCSECAIDLPSGGFCRLTIL